MTRTRDAAIVFALSFMLTIAAIIAGVIIGMAVHAGEADLRLQRELNRSGCDAGEPDGIIGEQTRDAIRCYQRRHGLEVTGEATGRTMRHLFGGEGGGNYAGGEGTGDIAAAVTIDRRAFERCGEPVTASGEKKTFRSRAQSDALKVWKTVVADRYGTSYVNMSLAQETKIRCRPACATCTISFECEVSAIPCREE